MERLDQKTGLDGAIITGAKALGDSFRTIRRIGKQISERAGDALADISAWREDFQKPITPEERGKQVVGEVVSRGMELGRSRSYRLIDRIRISGLPDLLEDPKKNARLKRDIIEHLDSRMGAELPLSDQIETVVKICFDKGIPPEKLIEFFKHEDLLEMLIEEVITIDESRYSGLSLTSIFSSVIDSIISRLDRFVESKSKIPVTSEIEKKIVKHFLHLKAQYNPEDPQRNIATFIKLLKEKYPDYDITTWLLENSFIFINLVRQSNKGKKVFLIEDIIKKKYIERAKQGRRREFIEMRMDKIFYPSSDGKGFELDVDEVRRIFDEEFHEIKNSDTGYMTLRGILIYLIQVRIHDTWEQEDKKKEQKGKVERTRIRIIGTSIDETKDFEHDIFQLLQEIENNVKRYTKTESFYIDIENLLAEPEDIPFRYKKEYERFIGPNGEVNDAYYQHFSSIFHLDSSKEDVKEKIKQIFEHMFEIVRIYLFDIAHTLKIDDIPDCIQAILNLKDYPALLRIMYESESIKERFAARKMIELAWISHACMYNRNFLSAKKDRRVIAKNLEAPEQGLKIDKEQPVHIVYVLDQPDELPRIIDPDEVDQYDEDFIRKIYLRASTFGETPCHVLVTNNGNSKDAECAYIDLKELFSMMTKSIYEREHPRNITDILRMTIVANSFEDLLKLVDHLVTNYFVFGMVLKQENRYGKMVPVSSVNVKDSHAKADDYKALRYVLEVLTEHGYVAIEIRIILLEDLVKEQSRFHKPGHFPYEVERLRYCMDTLEPPQISPHLWKIIEPEPDDLYQEGVVVFIDRTGIICGEHEFDDDDEEDEESEVA